MSPEIVDCKLPTRVLFGAGSTGELGRICREAGATRILCVTDPGVAAAGHLDRCLESLRNARLHATAFDAVHENPTTLDVEAGLAAARETAPDFLVALGGGSAMDCAKGINFLYSSGGAVEDYWGKDRAPGPMLGLLAVPTTAGTGSEVQSFAIISDPRTHQKMACGDKKAAPRIALLDPELTLTLPPAVTAATGIDAISHAVESFVSTAGTPLSRSLSLEAWTLLSRSLDRVMRAGNDLEARGAMLRGSALAGAAIEHSMLGAAHSAANPVTARHDVVHGLAVGLLLPHIVRYNSSSVADEYRKLLEAARIPTDPGQDAGEALAGWLERLLVTTGLPRRLGEVGLSASECAGASEEASRQWTAQFNPRPLKPADFLALYEGAL